MNVFKDKAVLVTGVCGTIGKELVNQLLSDKYQVKALVGIDNNESGLFFIDQLFLDDKRANFYLCDIRSERSLDRLVEGVDIIIHAAALKHVVMCERSPDQAIETNITGVQHLIKSALKHNVERVLFTSSDKAVNPTNVMGTTKLMGERLITAAHVEQNSDRTIFASTRFGNVLGSSGSVVPIFNAQIERGGPLSLTDRRMTRFIMSIKEAVALVLDTVAIAKGGEVFITKMPVARILDLAQALINAKNNMKPFSVDPNIKEIGIKPGEKLYEELMTDEEAMRSIELKKHFVVLPAFRGLYESREYSYLDVVKTKVTETYISSNQSPLSVAEIQEFLEKNNLLDSKNDFSLRYWPGDKKIGS